MTQKYQSIVVGWDEWISLPELGLGAVKAKVDTGAQSSSLHAVNIEAYKKDGVEWVRYLVHPLPDRPEVEIACNSQVVAKRNITSSNGETEERYIIRTQFRLEGQEWPIELSLANREDMQYRMLLGRSTMSGRMVVDPDGSMLCGELSVDFYDVKKQKQAKDRKLRIGVLSRATDNYSADRLVDIARSRGHTVDVIDAMSCYTIVSRKKPNIRYEGETLQKYDAIIPFVEETKTSYGMAIVRQFEMMGIYVLNTAEAIGSSYDKLFVHQLLARAGVGMPVTSFAHSPSNVRDLLKSVGKAPLILKPLDGLKGSGSVLAETQSAAASVVRAYRGLGTNMLVQEFIAENNGAVVRCVVIGNKVAGVVKRQTDDGKFRANPTQDWTACAMKTTTEERAAAIKAAKSIGLRFAVVDLLQSSDGPKVLDVNSFPDFEEVEDIAGLNVAGQVIDYLEQAVHRRQVRRKRPTTAS